MGSQAVQIYGKDGATGLPLGSDPAAPLYTAAAASTLAATSGTFKRATAVGATPGDALFVTGVTTAGTITVTLANGGSLTVNVPLGSSILPLGATNAVLGTAIGGTFQSLFFT